MEILLAGLAPSKASGAPLGYFLVLRRFNNGDPLGGVDPVQGSRSALRLLPSLEAL